MSNNYDHKYFIGLCWKMSATLNEVPSPEVDISFDEWESITHRAVKSVKESLYSLSDDKQRKFFLADIFGDIFNEMNNIFYGVSFDFIFNEKKIQEYAQCIIAERQDNPWFATEPECFVKPWDRYFLHSKSAAYIDRCALSVYTFTDQVSELCYMYGINFEEIIDKVMVWNNVSSGDLRPYFHYRASSGGYMVRGEYEPGHQQAPEETAKVIPLKQPSEQRPALEFSDIFYNQYKDHYMSFFDELKKDKFGFITLDNTWRNATRAYQYYELLQSSEFNVIRETLPDGTLIKSPMVAGFFENIFKVKPGNFRKSRTALKADDESLLKEAIKAVVNRIQ